jgi:F-type H+-transporting ATPase subunit epsilon
MADTLKFDLVSPERMLASTPAREVQIPGADGDLTAMPGHAPAITTLRPGIVTAVTGEGTLRYVVTGGFAEIGTEGVSILAERGIAASDFAQADLDALLGEARKAREGTSGVAADQAGKRLSDIAAIGAQLGLSVAA